jgi:hypothetical protein
MWSSSALGDYAFWRPQSSSMVGSHQSPRVSREEANLGGKIIVVVAEVLDATGHPRLYRRCGGFPFVEDAIQSATAMLPCRSHLHSHVPKRAARVSRCIALAVAAKPCLVLPGTGAARARSLELQWDSAASRCRPIQQSSAAFWFLRKSAEPASATVLLYKVKFRMNVPAI